MSEGIRTAFAEVVRALLAAAKVPVGMQILYDMLATVEVAHEVGARFVRLDVFADDVETRWGFVPASAAAVAARRRRSDARPLVLLTDVHVKHARTLGNRSVRQSAAEAAVRGSDALVVTGDRTGTPPTAEDCLEAKAAAGSLPVVVGSGLTADNAAGPPATGGQRDSVASSHDRPGHRSAKGDGAGRRRRAGEDGPVKLACVGDVGIDHYLNLGVVKPGGSTFNVAYHARQSGLDAALVSAVGDDAFGSHMLRVARTAQLEFLSRLRQRPGTTAAQAIHLGPDGERRFVGYDPQRPGELAVQQEDTAFVARHDAVYAPSPTGCGTSSAPSQP